MKKTIVTIGLWLAVGMASVVCTSCEKKNNEPLPPDTENPENPENPKDPENPTNQYNWIQVTEYISYAADGVTEVSRIEYTYDADGRETGYEMYLNGVLTTKGRDYQYNGRTITFWADSYSNGSLATSGKLQKTYSENNWIQVTQSIGYIADGITVSSRQEQTYDADGRETGYEMYLNGVLTTKGRDYQYNGRSVTFWSDSYSNGSLIGSVKNQRTYSERNWIQVTQYITYAADGVTESSRLEYTYDADGRETGYEMYVNGVLTTQGRDYQYNGRTITLWIDSYSNGNVQSSARCQRTYR